MTHPDDEGFLARWSRRKHATALAKADPAKPAALDEAPTNAVSRASDAEPDAAGCEDGVATAAHDGDSGGQLVKRVLTEADFADVDFTTLDFRSDYTRFMQHGVPDSVRNKALRQLWASDPIMANMDGLHDYWDDYTDAAVAVPAGTLKTAYRVGKGFLSDAEVAEWDVLGKPATAPAAVAATGPDAPHADNVSADGTRPDSERTGPAGTADPMPAETKPVEPRAVATVAAPREASDD
ncbi:MAG: DUF3306 domain-containing protein [Hyphomicrobiaceae bacterium]|nr:DUF3306 domain-containing protein [Hyphomicrobiaceae bacterium]